MPTNRKKYAGVAAAGGKGEAPRGMQSAAKQGVDHAMFRVGYRDN